MSKVLIPPLPKPTTFERVANTPSESKIAYNWFQAINEAVGGTSDIVSRTIANGIYEPLFDSGYLQWSGNANSFNASINLLFGTSVPNPSGIRAPFLLIGSNTPQAWIGTDQQYTVNSVTVNLGITAGEAQPGSIVPGGSLSLYGGAGANGTGGQVLVQGGTSLYGAGSDLTLSGGGSTYNVAGNVYIIRWTDWKSRWVRQAHLNQHWWGGRLRICLL